MLLYSCIVIYITFYSHPIIREKDTWPSVLFSLLKLLINLNDLELEFKITSEFTIDYKVNSVFCHITSTPFLYKNHYTQNYVNSLAFLYKIN